jgi:cell division ATPase FtsA
MHIVTAAAAQCATTSRRSGAPFEVEALVVSPYAASLACLVEDDGARVTVIGMGGGTTTVSPFDSNLVFADTVRSVAAMTRDIARGLDPWRAERLKRCRQRDCLDPRDEERSRCADVRRSDGHAAVPKSLLAAHRPARRDAEMVRKPARREAASTRSPAAGWY